MPPAIVKCRTSAHWWQAKLLIDPRNFVAIKVKKLLGRVVYSAEWHRLIRSVNVRRRLTLSELSGLCQHFPFVFSVYVTGKDYRISTLHYRWSLGMRQGLQHVQCTDSVIMPVTASDAHTGMRRSGRRGEGWATSVHCCRRWHLHGIVNRSIS